MGKRITDAEAVAATGCGFCFAKQGESCKGARCRALKKVHVVRMLAAQRQMEDSNVADARAQAMERAAAEKAKHHPSVTHVLKYFKYDHLPPHLQAVSKPFAELAQQVADRAPNNPETTVALRQLLESKDSAVRAALP